MAEIKNTSEDSSNGDCLKLAFNEAGYPDVEVSPWTTYIEIESLCTDLGLKLHSRESDTFPPKNTPVIAIYHSRANISHAELTTNLNVLRERGETIMAIIELPTAVN